jgi:hypothetical protein
LGPPPEDGKVGGIISPSVETFKESVEEVLLTSILGLTVSVFSQEANPKPDSENNTIAILMFFMFMLF